jgi:sn-glycerol 3-phosphate transport system permease protein
MAPSPAPVLEIVFPLLSPTTFFLLVVNIIYAFFDTFGVIHALTQGGPGGPRRRSCTACTATAYINLDLGGSSAQSVILMAAVIALTAIQFRYIERRVHY